MSRFGDVGAYRVGNVRIITTSANHREARHTDEHKAKVSLMFRGKPKSLVHRRRIGKALVGKKHSAESKLKMSISAKNRRKPEIGKGTEI
jgi:hypothetical protein